jgi:hypothetical protein
VMSRKPSILPLALLIGGSLVLPTPPAHAENRCSASVTRGGKRFDLRNYAVAYFSSEHSVMIWFTETPLSSGEEKSFQSSAFARERDIHGKYLTMMSLQFCPGGGSSSPAPGDLSSPSRSGSTRPTRSSWRTGSPMDRPGRT